MRSLTLGAMLFLLLASALRADWQYTKWGMTEAEVVAASKGAAVPVPEAESKKWTSAPRLSAPYNTGNFHFNAFFSLDAVTHGLKEVSLHLDGGFEPAVALRNGLSEKYGKPGKEDGSMSANDSTSTRDLVSHHQSIEWWTATTI